MADAVKIRGLKEFQRELTRGSKQMRREVGKANKRIGERVVVKPAQDRMRRAAKGRGGYLGAAGIKGSASTTSLKVLLSGGNPRTLGDEFGARAYRQFRPWTGNQWVGFAAGGVGYAVHPTIRENEQKILREYLDTYEDVLKGAFPS